MTLRSGTRLGAYEIISAIGAGGMGEVYRGRDTRLNRDVALKVLPDAFTLDPERLARFKREAQVLAALSHPNIAGIYGLDEVDGQQFLALELVEGETLQARLARLRADTNNTSGHAMPVDEALAITRQLVDALEAAHDKGIVHRDLKPANIALTGDAQVKVLDFGLAKALEPAIAADQSISPTLTFAATQAGVILGTAAYMSPEQAKGRQVDKRSDIWSLGCVLFEMLSGKRPFEGEDVSDTLAAVLRAEPDWNALPGDLPQSIERIVRRSLERDRRKRIGDVSTIRFLLDEAAAPAAAEVRTGPVTDAPARPVTWSWKLGVAALLFAVGAAALGGFAVWATRERPLPPIVTRFPIALAEGQQFTTVSDLFLAVSPDGSKLAYVANRRLYLRSMSDLEAQPIRGTEVNPRRPMFSPDGSSIAYYSTDERALKRVAVTGGASVTIATWQALGLENPELRQMVPPLGATWTGEHIFVGTSTGVVRVPAAAGKPETILRLNADEYADAPYLLPDGDHLLFTLGKGREPDRWEKAQIVAQSLTTGARKVLIDGGADGRFLRSGHLVYALGGVLYAVRFDLRAVRVVGAPVPILEGVRRANNPGLNSGASLYVFSETGTLAYVRGPVTSGAARYTLGWLDRKGAVEALKLPTGNYRDPRIAPDGRQLAFGTDDGRVANIFVYDLSGTSAARPLTLSGNNRFPAWSSDSRRIAFQSDREGDPGIFWQRADGTGTIERLTKPDKGAVHTPESFSPDAKWLLFRATRDREETLMALSLDDGKIAPFGDVRSTQPTDATFSPDGKWVAYTTRNAVATSQIYVQSFPSTGQPYQLTKGDTGNAHHPFWSRNGRELFFIPGAGQFAVIGIETRPTFSFSDPVALSRGPLGFIEGGPSVRRQNDVAADGRVIAILAGDPAQAELSSLATPQVQVVLNWFTELQQHVPTR